MRKGRQPQEDDPIQKIIEEQESHTKKLKKLSNDVPISFLDRQKEIIKDFKGFKTEIQEEVQEIVEKIAEVKQKIQVKKFDKESMQGLLTCNINEYLDCFSVQTAKLEQLFEKDLQVWNNNLQKTQKAVKKMKGEIQVFLSKTETQLADLLNPARFMKFEPELKKLPLIGTQVGDGEWDFEWPKQEEFNKMANQNTIEIEAIDVYYGQSYGINGIQVTLNNGQQSDLFQVINRGRYNRNQGYPNHGYFDVGRAISRIGYYSSIYSENIFWIQGLRFYNQNGDVEANFNPYGYGDTEKQDIPPNHVIVGIYGVRNQAEYITSLGFIIREKQQD